MKQKDIAVIVVIAIISGVVSFFVSSKIFVTPANRQQQVEVVDPINATFQPPSSKYFNSSSVDAAPTINIGTNNNQNPFNTTQ